MKQTLGPGDGRLRLVDEVSRIPVGFKVPKKQEKSKYVVEIERECDFAEFCLDADLITAILLKGFKFGDSEIFDLGHNPFGIIDRMNHYRIFAVFATGYHKLILKLMIFDGVSNIQFRQVLIFPEVSDLVQ